MAHGGHGSSTGEHIGKGKRHELDSRELKLAVYSYLRERGMTPLPNHGSFIQLELIHTPEDVIGAKVWFTREMEPGQKPEFAARVQRRAKNGKEREL